MASRNGFEQKFQHYQRVEGRDGSMDECEEDAAYEEAIGEVKKIIDECINVIVYDYHRQQKQTPLNKLARIANVETGVAEPMQS